MIKKEYFKPLDSDGYELLCKLTGEYAWESCERSWSNLLLYMDTYNWHYAWHEKRLWIISFEAAYCFFPLGEWLSPCELAEELQNLAVVCGSDMICGDIPFEYPAKYPEFSRCLTLNDDEGDYDYIYKLDYLNSFSGSKLRKRHNQVRQFDREYEGRFVCREIEFSDLDDILTLAERLSGDAWHSDSGKEEQLALGRLKKLWQDKACNLHGIVLEVAAQKVGFSIYSGLQGAVNCADIHFEKADHAYCGCGAKLTAVLVETLLKNGYQSMNREQDMNIEGLKRSKRALDPDHLFKRLNAEIFLPIC